MTGALIGLRSQTKFDGIHPFTCCGELRSSCTVVPCDSNKASLANRFKRKRCAETLQCPCYCS